MLEDKSFKKRNRLLNKTAFSSVLSAQKKRFCGTFILYTHENSYDHPRMGIIISKKQVRLASDRNRIRRMVKETFRENIASLPNIDIVLIGLHPMQHLTGIEILRCIEKQWHYFRQISVAA